MQFTFFPYFPSLNFDLKIGRIHLFNFWQFKDTYIADSDIKVTLEKICGMYVNNNLKRAENLTVCVFDNDYSFGELSQDQVKDISKYALSLMFCSVTQNHCSSENFVFFHQSFGHSGTRVNYTSGSFVSVEHIMNNIFTKKFVAPEYVHNPFNYDYDDQLFEALIKAIDSGSIENEKIFHSLEWVRQACMNFDYYSTAIRPVMMTTAFEIFFSLQDKKEDDFAIKLETLLGTSDMHRIDTNGTSIKGLPLIKKNNVRGKEKENTMYGWWARDFYSLRSKIVHEGRITPSDWTNSKGNAHVVIALMMMNFCLYCSMAQKGFLDYPPNPEDGFKLDFNATQFFKEQSIASKIENLL